MKKLMVVLTVAMGSSAFAADAKFELKGDAAKGETTYKTLCVACHGEKGDGNGPAGASLTPKPTNFTDAANADRLKDEYVYKVIKEGGAANGRSPLMIAWGGTIKDDEVRNVAAFVQKFKPAAAAPAAKKPAAKK